MSQITFTNRHLQYFQNPAHKKVDTFYFTSDGLAFFTENAAGVQAANLKKKGKSDAVTPVTRAEFNAWINAAKEAGTNNPQTVLAQENADAAQTALETANAQITLDNTELATAQQTLKNAQATNDATAIAAAQAALTAIQSKLTADTAAQTNAQNVAAEKQATLNESKAANTASKK